MAERLPKRVEDKQDAIIGCLLGTAVGDAVGLCGEGLSRKRLARVYPNLNGPHLLLGRGMVSDDTEHACMTAQALIASAGDPSLFQPGLASLLRLWLLGIPAGVGLATLKSILKLWGGVSPARSGVFSAGNGPAMRSPLLGVCYGEDLSRLRELVRVSTRLTHTDPKAEYGAFAVALAAHVSARGDPLDPAAYGALLRQTLGEEAREMILLVECAVESADAGQTTAQFADTRGWERGIGGYVYQTVPIVLHAWFRHPKDVRNAVLETIGCGGDTDTTGAIVGAIVGAGTGKVGVPADWLARVWEWPRTVAWIEKLGTQLAEVLKTDEAQKPPTLFFPAILPRNAVFLLVILAHGFRRMFPPYS